MITIEKLKNNIGNWIITYNSKNILSTMQRIDEVIPQNLEGVLINGPIIESSSLKIVISKNSHSYRYLKNELSNIKIITDEDFRKQIGEIIYNSIIFKI